MMPTGDFKMVDINSTTGLYLYFIQIYIDLLHTIHYTHNMFMYITLMIKIIYLFIICSGVCVCVYIFMSIEQFILATSFIKYFIDLVATVTKTILHFAQILEIIWYSFIFHFIIVVVVVFPFFRVSLVFCMSYLHFSKARKRKSKQKQQL